ncbi:hypothetical protein FRB99_008982, partial [Tulasnella sp. 403]
MPHLLSKLSKGRKVSDVPYLGKQDHIQMVQDLAEAGIISLPAISKLSLELKSPVLLPDLSSDSRLDRILADGAIGNGLPARPPSPDVKFPICHSGAVEGTPGTLPMQFAPTPGTPEYEAIPDIPYLEFSTSSQCDSTHPDFDRWVALGEYLIQLDYRSVIELRWPSPRLSTRAFAQPSTPSTYTSPSLTT